MEIKRRQDEGTTVFILKGCFSVLEGVRLQLEDTKKELSQADSSCYYSFVVRFSRRMARKMAPMPSSL